VLENKTKTEKKHRIKKKTKTPHLHPVNIFKTKNQQINPFHFCYDPKGSAHEPATTTSPYTYTTTTLKTQTT
jgi:hypothetical protein